MSVEERPLRADAERNRARLLETAQTLFRKRGLEVSVTEIAEAAGVGRGTLFRNFASKEDLIAAIVAEGMHEVAGQGRALLDHPDATAAVFEFLEDMIGRRQLNRDVAEALDESWLAREDIRTAQEEILGVLGELLARGQAAGGVRSDVGATDVLMLFKGACVAASQFGQGDPAMLERHLDLIKASLVARPDQAPLRGRAPTL
jgi:AcrR family transcriptional regulator